jgi:anti-sigma-K factor RskA
MQGSFTPANSTDWPSFQLALSENTTIGAKSRVKLGDKINYRVGWRLFNSTTNATAYTSVDSDLQLWTLVDSATALSATLSLAAVVALVSF